MSQTSWRFKLISSIIGGIIVVITGLTQLEKYQENWILYRTSSELLKKEKYFENRVGEYSNLDQEERNKLLVERGRISRDFKILYNSSTNSKERRKKLPKGRISSLISATPVYNATWSVDLKNCRIRLLNSYVTDCITPICK
ncbi:MAG: DUF4231 domain-containing protein, partial [Candidatus Nitrosopolaris sp.]